jgi:hypothetical protein
VKHQRSIGEVLALLLRQLFAAPACRTPVASVDSLLPLA